ncbi:hypothetical protein HPG69_005281 [Diceros bicornis minor]|uniref:Transmembrane protein 176A n=1 Tax=Diceros bicornis minor TaxID=77932 RepID=A0A7J7ETF3_DICBM|nr:hypothetical protein HPG69_005281 [Diceros bicornis minor]
MSTGMRTVDHGEVAPGAPQPTHIDVHIHQESALAKLLLSGCSLLRSPSQTLGSRRLLVASWVVQIVLGVFSGVLGGFLYFFYSPLCNLGAAIWTGVVAVLAGAVAFIYEKQGGFYWGWAPGETESPRSLSASSPHQAQLRTLLALAAFSTATAAVVLGADNFYEYRFHFRDYICDISPSGSWPTMPPHTPSPEEVRRLHLCLSYLNMLKGAKLRELHGSSTDDVIRICVTSFSHCLRSRRSPERDFQAVAACLETKILKNADSEKDSQGQSKQLDSLS